MCLIIDSARCHKTVKVRDKCRELNIKHFLIPPRLTGLLQPADVKAELLTQKIDIMEYVKKESNVVIEFDV